MGNSIKLQLSLEKEIYLPGQTIKGELLIVAEKPIAIKGVNVTLDNREHWMKSEATYMGVVTQYRNTWITKDLTYAEQYLDLSEFLVHDPRISNSRVLPPSEHKLKISLKIPIYAKASLKVKDGFCTHYINCTPNWDKKTKSLEKKLIMMESLPYFLEKNFFNEVIKNWGKDKKKSSIKLKVSIPKDTYKVGDKVPITILIFNKEGNNNVKSVLVSLYQKLEYGNVERFMKITELGYTNFNFQVNPNSSLTKICIFTLNVADHQSFAPTFYGHALRITYYLTIQVQLEGFFAPKGPSMNAPINIFNYLFEDLAKLDPLQIVGLLGGRLIDKDLIPLKFEKTKQKEQIGKDGKKSKEIIVEDLVGNEKPNEINNDKDNKGGNDGKEDGANNEICTSTKGNENEIVNEEKQNIEIVKEGNEGETISTPQNDLIEDSEKQEQNDNK